MSKVQEYGDFVITVRVGRPFWVQLSKSEANVTERWRREVEEIAHKIRVRLDEDVDTEVDRESRPVCEHCGAQWTEASEDYNGGCCDADQEAEEARDAAMAEGAGDE